MRIAIAVLFLPLFLAGCLSFSSTPASKETIVVPATSTSTTTIICANGAAPPC